MHSVLQPCMMSFIISVLGQVQCQLCVHRVTELILELPHLAGYPLAEYPLTACRNDLSSVLSNVDQPKALHSSISSTDSMY